MTQPRTYSKSEQAAFVPEPCEDCGSTVIRTTWVGVGDDAGGEQFLPGSRMCLTCERRAQHPGRY
jgi:hypothetical protein